MKVIISESQYNRLIETEKKPKILEFPSLEFFDNDPFEAWTIIQKIIEKKGNPPYSIDGDLDLGYSRIKSLGNLTSVGGNLDLEKTPIQSLGNLTSVGGGLLLGNTPIESLGNLTSVGGDLYLHGTPLSIYTREQIREMVNVEGRIFK